MNGKALIITIGILGAVVLAIFFVSDYASKAQQVEYFQTKQRNEFYEAEQKKKLEYCSKLKEAHERDLTMLNVAKDKLSRAQDFKLFRSGRKREEDIAEATREVIELENAIADIKRQWQNYSCQ